MTAVTATASAYIGQSLYVVIVIIVRQSIDMYILVDVVSTLAIYRYWFLVTLSCLEFYVMF